MEEQNKTYELARVAMEDAFSTKPLNDNAEVVEAAINDLHATQMDLLRRVAALEVRKMAFGTYAVTSSGTFAVSVGFTPKLVFVLSLEYTGRSGVITPSSTGAKGAIISGGFQVTANGNNTVQVCFYGESYAYLAVA